MFIINYHNVLAEELDEFDARLPRTGIKQFTEEISFLNNHCQIVNINELMDNYLQGNKDQHKVSITFDDGCYGFFEHAIPFLQKNNIPASAYIITDCVSNPDEYRHFDSIEIAFRLSRAKRIDLRCLELGKVSVREIADRVKYMKYVKRKLKLLNGKLKNEYQAILLKELQVNHDEMQEFVFGKNKYRYVSWDNIRQIHHDGFDIGSHTHTHPTLSKIDTTQLTLELQLPFELIRNKLAKTDISLAYPHGSEKHIGGEAPVAAMEAGYKFALSTIAGSVETSINKFLVNRVTFEEFKALTTNE